MKRTAAGWMVVVMVLVVGLLAGGTAQAETYYYDNNTNAAGFGAAGGTWSAPTPGPNPGWSTNGAGTTVPESVTTAIADDLNFGNGATGLAAGTITISGSVDAGNLTFASGSGAITLSGGTSINLGAAATITLNNASDTISSVLAGAATSVTKAGTGQLTLSGVNSFTGQLNIENGTVFTSSINNKSVNGVLGAGTLVVLGASGQTGRLAIQVDGGVSSTKDFTLATGGTGEIRFGNIGTFQITNADRSMTLSGTIGGGGNLVKLGGAALVLSGSNNYSGTTIVNEGPLRLSHANALPGGIGATGGTSALTINGGSYGAVVALANGNFLRGLGAGIDQFQIPGGISGFDANGAARQVIVGNDPSFELAWGSAYFNPSALLLGYHSVSATGALTLQNKIDLNGTTRTIAVNANTATLSGDIRTSSGTAGITKTGAGTLVLSGNNTFNGPTTISAGTLTISDVGTINNTSQIVLSGTSTLNVNATNASLTKLVTGGGVPLGTFLRYSQPQTAAGAANGPGTIRGTVEINLTNVNPDYTLDFGHYSTFKNLVVATYTSPITLSGDASIDSSTAVFTLNTGGITASTAGTKTLTLTGSNTGANTISSVIGNGSGTIAVTKASTGTWTLSGANTYSGATTVSAGTLTLSGANGAIGSSAVTIAGSTLTISNANAANSGDRLSGSLAFTMNGGTFNFNNDASANDFSEIAGTLTLIGGANTVAIGQAASGRTSTLTFAGLSRTAGAINFSGAGLGTSVNPRSKITFTSVPTLTDGIIGPWATVNGDSYATLAGNDVVAYGGTMTDLTRQSSGTKVIPDSASADVRIIEGTGGSPANLTLAATTNTIRTLMQSISGGTSTATVDIASGQTLLVNSINQVATAGALTLGTAVDTGTLTPATAGGNLLLINNSTAVANSMTVNSVVADHTSASTVTKDGAGVVRLPGNNTYSGGTLINAGTLVVKADANLGTAGTGITFNGTAALSFGNHPATGALTVNTGTRPITINNGAVAGLYHNWADTTITIGGAVTGNGGIIWGRDPVLTYGGGSGSVYINLNSTGNTFTGPITVGTGNDNAQGYGSTFSFNSLGDSASPITFNFQYGVAFNFNATGPTSKLSVPNRPVNLLTSSATINNMNATNTMTLGPVSTSTAGAKTLNLGSGGAGGFVTGAITDGNGQIGLTRSGSGTWTLSGANTYSGVTSIGDGSTLAILGTQALAPASKIVMTRSATLRILTDDSGVVNFGNNIEFDRVDNATAYIQNYTVHVGNNGGATTGSTIVFGNLDFTKNDMRPPRQLTTTGANSYSVRVGNVFLATEIQGTATGGAQRFTPASAALEIAGTVKQINGNTGTQPTANTLYLGGAMTGNLVSGAIANANDYPANPTAAPLNIYKGDAGDWTLTGVNTYSGTTTVNAGTLVIDGGTKSQCLPDAGLLAISGTGKLRLNAGVREKVGSLRLGAGATIAGPATYGSSASRAANTNDTYFTGTGVLYVGLDIPSDGMILIIN